MADSAREGLPIAKEQTKPSLSALIFYTDAAGSSYTKVKGEKMFHDCKGRGVACIAGEDTRNMWIWTRLEWNVDFLLNAVDEKGCSYGCKSTTLESVGVLLPLVAFPELIRGRNIVFRIDNMAVVFGWRSGRVKNDRTATGILKAAKYMSAFLGTTIYIEHVPRVSNEMATLADEMSRREKSKYEEIARRLEDTEYREVQGYLTKWHLEPRNTEKLCSMLLEELKKKFTM